MSAFLKEGRILLVSSQTSQRSSLRKALMELGALHQNIEVAADVKQAKERLEKSPIHILITDDEIGDARGINLMDLHSKNNSSSRERVFILMTSETSPFLMAEFALKGGDAIISKPFTSEAFSKKVSLIMKEKEKLTSEEKILMDIQDAVATQDVEKSQALMEGFKDPSSLEAMYGMALVHELQNDAEKAFELYYKVLTQKVNFKSLVQILKVGSTARKFTELLQFVEVWLKEFPIHHNSLPDMTRVIISNQKFDLLDDLFQLFSQHKMDDDFAKVPLAAGFVLASKHHLDHGDKTRAKVYALKSVEYACGRYQILSRSLEILSRLGEKKEAEKVYGLLESDVSTPEGKISDLKLKALVFSETEIIKECYALLTSKIIDPAIYDIMIKCSRSIGKDPADIIKLAHKSFPDRAFA